MVASVLLGFTFFSNELPHIISYIVFGLHFGLGTYLIIKTIKFRVIVHDDKITVQDIFIKSYTFTFSEIISVNCQVKSNNVKSERMIIKIKSGKKLIVETPEISYYRFLNTIKSEVKSKYLFPFENLLINFKTPQAIFNYSCSGHYLQKLLLNLLRKVVHQKQV